MPEFVIDTTVSVWIDADDFEMAERVATELEHLYMEAAEPSKARFWTKIEEARPIRCPHPDKCGAEGCHGCVESVTSRMR